MRHDKRVMVPPAQPQSIDREKEMSMSLKRKMEMEGSMRSLPRRRRLERLLWRMRRVTRSLRRRAYEIYLERGEQPGRDLDDWLQAERELERGILSPAGRLGSKPVDL